MVMAISKKGLRIIREREALLEARRQGRIVIERNKQYILVLVDNPFVVPTCYLKCHKKPRRC